MKRRPKNDTGLGKALLYTGLASILLFIVSIICIVVGMYGQVPVLGSAGVLLLLPTLGVMFVASVMGRAHWMESMSKSRRRR